MAYDISLAMIQITKARANKLHLGERTYFVLGDCENMTVRDEAFDVVLCIDTFHYFPDPLRALSEFKRICKRKGLVIVNVPNREYKSVLHDLQRLLAKSNRLSKLF